MEMDRFDKCNFFFWLDNIKLFLLTDKYVHRIQNYASHLETRTFMTPYQKHLVLCPKPGNQRHTVNKTRLFRWLFAIVTYRLTLLSNKNIITNLETKINKKLYQT